MSYSGEARAKKREDRQGGGVKFSLSGGDERSEPESQTEFWPPASTRNIERTEAATGGGAGRSPAPRPLPLPCLFVTTASEEKTDEENRPVPGPRKKQADALTENIKWLAVTFGKEHIAFLTLTLGDKDAGGRYRNLRNRKEAQRRFHSLLTNVIAKRYKCGVTITERHRNGGIHFHLAVVCADDIRGEIDFAACFPSKDFWGKPVHKADYSTANDAIKREWAFWRRTAKFYGFGRHQLQPMRENGEALGRYLGAYLSKDWENRLPEDKGARCVRYFGHWSAQARKLKERRKAPPQSCRFGWLTARAQAWREMVKQTVTVLKYKGVKITQENIKDIAGAKWAWKLGKLFESVRFEIGDWQSEAVRETIGEHNFKVEVRWLSGGGDPARSCWWHVTEISLDHVRPSPEWKKQGDELQLAKECEAAIRKRLKELAKRKAHRAEQLRLVGEVADLLQAEHLKAKAILPATCGARPTSG
jgi:hypothetical protein